MVAGLLVLIILYIIISKFCCNDVVATIPTSGLVSTMQVAGKLQSVSSIKTIKSDQEAGGSLGGKASAGPSKGKVQRK